MYCRLGEKNLWCPDCKKDRWAVLKFNRGDPVWICDVCRTMLKYQREMEEKSDNQKRSKM
jgi:ribosomal protein L37AE/L43A